MKLSKKIAFVALSSALIAGCALQTEYFNKSDNTSVVAFAEDTYKLNYFMHDGYVSVFRFSGIAENVEIPAEYNGLPVKVIEEYAFAGQTGIKSVKIPDSVETICEGAFSSCTNLAEVSIPESVTEIEGYAFSNTKWLYKMREKNPVVSVNNIVIDGEICGKSATIPDGTVAVSDGAFAGCYELSDVKIPSSVKRIGGTAFRGTPWEANMLKNNKKIVVNGILVKSMEDKKSDNTITVDCDTVSSYAFADNDVYTDIILKGDCSKIGKAAFSGLQNLKSFTFSSSVEEIDDNAFQGCLSLSNVKFDNNLKRIGNSAFEHCENMKVIDIPESVEYIGISAFDLRSASEITINNPDCFIGSYTSTFNPNITVKGHNGSTAEEYAKKYNLKFVSIDPETTATTTVSTTTTTTTTTTTDTTTTTVPVSTLPQMDADKLDESTEVIPGIPSDIKLYLLKTLGDANGDSKIDSSDASLMLTEYSRIATGQGATIIGDGKAVCDLNNDGIIDASDASFALIYYAYVQTGGKESISSVLRIISNIKGDVNCDGFVDLCDLATLRQFISKQEISRFSYYNADIDNNGVVDLTDLSNLSLRLLDNNTKGDVNGDGSVSAEDVLMFELYFIDETTPINRKNADIDENGVVDISDYTCLVNVVLGKTLKGDVDGDNEVTLADLATLRQYISKQEVTINESNADIDGNGVVDITDLSHLSRILMGDE